MPYVGIRKTAAGYRITDPLSVSATRTFVHNIILDAVLKDQDDTESQHLMEYKYEHETQHTTRLGHGARMFWSRIRLEQPLWHIHGIIATVTLVYGLLGLFAWANVKFMGMDQFLPTSQVAINATIAAAAGAFSLGTVVNGSCPYLRLSSGILTITYTYFAVWFWLAGISNTYQQITTIAFGLIAGNVFFDWTTRYKNQKLLKR
jgi:hypothetical protein